MLQSIPLFTKNLVFPKRSTELRAMVANGGHEKRTESAYDWDGEKRGTKPFVIVQWTAEGRGMLEFEGREWRVEPPHLMLLTVPQRHRYWFDGATHFWRFAYVSLAGAEVLRICRQIIGRHGPLLRLEPDSQAGRLLTATVAAVGADQIVNEYQSSQAAYAVAMALLENTELRLDDTRPTWLQNVLGYCQKNFGRPIGIADMAEIAGFSRYHFTRRFKEHMGIPPGRYLQELRFTEAARRLIDTRAGIKQIATECGFNHVGFFCRAFRKRFETSPGMYRRQGV